MKEGLRQEALARRKALSAERRVEAAQALIDRILPLDLNSSIAGYWPFGSELDPRPLLEALQKAGHSLALPVVTGEALAFHAWNFGAPLVTGPFGILQPASETACIPQTILVPLVAFDRTKHRIGYGRGYYDRALSQYSLATSIGLAFREQEVDTVPADPWDRALDMIVSV